ncbi:MAG: MlaD family protein [Acidimicrobiia bacterium]|nr:MlaD family protein [Acidimicrobiia bacterium]
MNSARAKRIAGIVGAFGVVLGAFLMLRFATASDTSRAMTAEFDKVTGLVTHSEMTYRGAKVGEVAAIDYSDDGEKAVLTLAFDRDVGLREDAKAEIKIKSLLGEQYIAIEPGTSPRKLEGKQIHQTASDLSLDDLLHTVAGLLGDITDSGQVARLVQDLTKTFEGKGKDLQAVVQNGQLMLAEMTARGDVLARILTNLDTLTQGLDGKETAIGDVLGQLAQTLRQLRASLSKNVETLNNAIETMRTTLGSLQTSKIQKGLDEIPEWLGKFDYVLGQLEGLTNTTIPIKASFVSLPPMDPRGLDQQISQIAKIPWLREYLIALFQDMVDKAGSS